MKRRKLTEDDKKAIKEIMIFIGETAGVKEIMGWVYTRRRYYKTFPYWRLEDGV